MRAAASRLCRDPPPDIALSTRLARGAYHTACLGAVVRRHTSTCSDQRVRRLLPDAELTLCAGSDWAMLQFKSYWRCVVVHVAVQSWWWMGA